MIRYITKQNKNKKSSAFGKWYAYPVVEETMDLAALAKHMEEHNSGFSEAICTGVMKAMVKCIKEQILAGKNVKIDDLAIFSCGIKNNKGASKEEDFTTTNNISGVKLRARATGVLRNSSLNLNATIRKANAVASQAVAQQEAHQEASPQPSLEGEGGQTGGGGNTNPEPNPGTGGDKPEL